jgi:hypothetical protein
LDVEENIEKNKIREKLKTQKVISDFNNFLNSNKKRNRVE